MKGFVKLNTLIFIFITSIILFSCNSGSELKIGMLIPNIVDDRFPKDRDYFTAEIQKLGGVVVAKDCGNDDKLQIRQAQELIAEGVKVLAVICVNKNTAATIVRDAHEKGVKVIAYDRIISNCDLDYYVSFDNVKVGELMAKGVLNKKNGGNFMLIGGDKSDQNAIWVREGMHKVLDPLVKEGKVNIVYDVFIEDWSGDNTFQEMKRYLNLKNELPDAIVAAYDGLTTGAIKAIDYCYKNLSEYPASSGQNAELDACQNIIKGKQTITVYKPLTMLAKQVAEVAIKIAKNESIEPKSPPTFNGSVEVPSFLIDPISVTSENMKSTIIADGFWKENEVYQGN